ncbi:MAG TPA: hypothetical protein VM692_16765 [Gammaproteobacteria bacterium]|nr:hypothetical protein [Gammaproteobacteria bacterium]
MRNISDVADTAGARSPSCIEAKVSAALPKLAWVAILDRAQQQLTVLHGRAVECRPRFVVEGVWDGPFDEGEFHNGAHLFGSGVRLDGGAVHFVPSAATVDRLVYCRYGDMILVSNSLLALLAKTGARLDPGHDYLIEARAPIAGVDCYDSAFHVLHPRIRRFHQLYHKVLTVRGEEITCERRIPVRTFASFDDYYGMLRECLAAICANADDAARRTRLATLGTLSTGYDSTAVCALIKDLGVRRYFTYVGSWGGQSTKDAPEYETAPIAAALDVETIRIEAPREPVSEDELLLRAASPLGQQLPLVAIASYVERNTEVAAVFTGFHGDIVWDLNVPDAAVSEGIVRHDISGLDLSELRLKSGFINVAVPFLHAASIKSIAAVSRSAEMAPWTVGTTYDRPISRRIVETAGVPRERFGFLKGGLFGGSNRPASAKLRARYFQYVNRNVMPLPMFYARVGLDHYTMRLLARAALLVKGRARLDKIRAALLEPFRRFNEGYSWYGRSNLRSTLYSWAAMELVTKLRERGIAEPTAGTAGRGLRSAAVR